MLGQSDNSTRLKPKPVRVPLREKEFIVGLYAGGYQTVIFGGELLQKSPFYFALQFFLAHQQTKKSTFFSSHSIVPLIKLFAGTKEQQREVLYRAAIPKVIISLIFYPSDEFSVFCVCVMAHAPNIILICALIYFFNAVNDGRAKG
jgi:hypothetical protein